MSLLCVQMSLLGLQRTLGSGGPQTDGERGRKHQRALAVEFRVLQQLGLEEVGDLLLCQSSVYLLGFFDCLFWGQYFTM